MNKNDEIWAQLCGPPGNYQRPSANHMCRGLVHASYLFRWCIMASVPGLLDPLCGSYRRTWPDANAQTHACWQHM